MPAKALPVTLVLVLSTAGLTADKAGPRVQVMSRQTLEDKIRGGWAGQMIGVSYGAPTEFKAQGKILEGDLPWSPDRVSNAIDQDDLYVEMTFARVMDTVGLGATCEQYGEAFKISQYHLDIVRDDVTRIALALGVRGLINAQFAIKDEIVYVLEVNPRSSRTVPFVSKATGVPLARIAAQVAAGKTLREIGFTTEPRVDGFFVKEVVLPFDKLEGAPIRLGPEMRSTGEVMGSASSFGHAFAKAQMAAGGRLPTEGVVFLSVNDFDKGAIVKLARDFHRLGFRLVATRGTAEWLNKVGLNAAPINKVSEGSPHVVDAMARGDVRLIVNTPLGRQAYSDGEEIRRAAIRYKIPLMTTLSATAACVGAIRALQSKELSVKSLQEHHRA